MKILFRSFKNTKKKYLKTVQDYDFSMIVNRLETSIPNINLCLSF